MCVQIASAYEAVCTQLTIDGIKHWAQENSPSVNFRSDVYQFTQNRQVLAILRPSTAMTISVKFWSQKVRQVAMEPLGRTRIILRP